MERQSGIEPNVLELFKPIRTFIFDIDGVIASNSMLATEEGYLLRKVHGKDGTAFALALANGYNVWVLSGGTAHILAERFTKMGAQEVHTAVKNKKELAQELAAKNNLSLDSALYMGDDLPDIQIMEKCRLACCPKDACNEAKAVSQYISPLNGGEGCVRDVIEKVLRLNGHWQLP